MSYISFAVLETMRAELHSRIDTILDEAVTKHSSKDVSKVVIYKIPSLADGHDLRNKNGQNLTPRGVEILYRVFDDGGGYNRASKMLNISQGAAKNRKALWVNLGGVNRPKAVLDIDSI